MEKNTIWAVVLSAIVFIGALTIQQIWFPPTPRQTNIEKDLISQENPQSQENNSKFKIEAIESEEPQTEEFFTYESEKIKVTFTNRGGDIIDFQLKSQNGSAVQMADNIREKNRAFALSFGGAENEIIEDLWSARKIDKNTIGFFKNYKITKKISDSENLNSKSNLQNESENSLQTEQIENLKNFEQQNFTLVKTYTFDPQEYLFKLEINIEGDENFVGLDFLPEAYTIRTSPQIGPEYNPKDRYEIREFMAYTNGKRKRTTVSPGTSKKFEKNWTWTGIAGKYFCELVLPNFSDAQDFQNSTQDENPKKLQNPKEFTGKIVYSAISENSKVDSQLKISRSAFSENSIHDVYFIYAGPRIDKELSRYNSAEKNAWGISSSKLNETLPNSGILSWVEAILKIVMELIYKVIPNWGVAIIILTAILKLAMFPLTKKTAMGTSKLSEIQPKITALQQKYAENPQKLNEETMKLYRQIGYNPMSGCLPMIFQFIILFAMYHLFNNYFEFRGASFIPGWIGDLSKGDSIKTLSFNLPLLGNEIRLLPVIYVVSQLFYGKITNNGGTANASQQGSMKFMMYGMPIMFFFLFYNAPSGLLLYWTISNAIQLGQQLAINSMMKKNRAVKSIKKTR